MPETVTSGIASISIDDADVLRRMDRVYHGAITEFITATDRVLDPTMQGARARWPVRTGKSKASFARRVQLGYTSVENRLENRATSSRWGFYAYRIRWSVRLEDSLDNEARESARAAMPFIRRGKSIEAQQRIARWVMIGKPKRKPGGGTKTLRGSNFEGITEPPTLDGMYTLYRARLTRRHGQGAPSADVAGKQPWRELVRKPADDRAGALAVELEETLAKLARGGA